MTVKILRYFIVVVSNSEAVLFLPFQLSEFPPASQADGLCFEVYPETARHGSCITNVNGEPLKEKTQNSCMEEVSLKLALGLYLNTYLTRLKPY